MDQLILKRNSKNTHSFITLIKVKHEKYLNFFLYFIGLEKLRNRRTN